MTADELRLLAQECGFELAGVTPAVPHADAARYKDWAARGMAGRMGYLTDHRAAVRGDPRNLLANARTVIAVAKIYNAPAPAAGPISRYAWGGDYHAWMRSALETLAAKMLAREAFDYRVCADTAPLLERSYAAAAGLGWIGRNTCLINQWAGSWLFLGELLVSLDIAADRAPAANRCGTCTRCVDLCPTRALVPRAGGSFELDARRCISYLTIELRGEFTAEQAEMSAGHVFGCDICQDVCPWNRRAAMTLEPVFQPRPHPPLDQMSKQDFERRFGSTPVARARYAGFVRNLRAAR